MKDLVPRMLAACGLGTGLVASCEELTEGTYNTAFRIRTVDGDGYVLKVAPDPCPGRSPDRATTAAPAPSPAT